MRKLQTTKERNLQHVRFKTSIGECGIAWSAKGIVSVFLPAGTPEETNRALCDIGSVPATTRQPAWLSDAVKHIQDLLVGKKANLSGIPVDFHNVPKFHEKVYRAVRKIEPGKLKTYGQLAKEAGSPQAARAVGQAMARNPIPLIIPCHRVVGSGKMPGGFSAYGGLRTKAKLLALEGVELFSVSTRKEEHESPRSPQEALRFLAQKDKALGSLIRKVGPFTLKPNGKQEPFHAFLESILYQQITGKAASTIAQRLKNLTQHKNFPSPSELLNLTAEQMRGAGISRNKTTALRDLAKHAMEGKIPSLRAIKKMSNEEIIERFTWVRGIGRWTVEMFLIFNLGRMDVLPSTDYGVRKGFSLIYSSKKSMKLPTPRDIEHHGEIWKPYRTIAAWYMWRAVDLLD